MPVKTFSTSVTLFTVLTVGGVLLGGAASASAAEVRVPQPSDSPTSGRTDIPRVTPTPWPTRNLASTVTDAPAPQASGTPTPSATPTPKPTVVPTAEPTVVPVPTPDPPVVPTPTPTATRTPTPTPTPTAPVVMPTKEPELPIPVVPPVVSTVTATVTPTAMPPVTVTVTPSTTRSAPAGTGIITPSPSATAPTEAQIEQIIARRDRSVLWAVIGATSVALIVASGILYVITIRPLLRYWKEPSDG